jgi:hypothetical protein
VRRESRIRLTVFTGLRIDLKPPDNGITQKKPNCTQLSREFDFLIPRASSFHAWFAGKQFSYREVGGCLPRKLLCRGE